MNAEEYVNEKLNLMIDELHPNYKPVTDEELVEDNEDHGVFERSFAHKDGAVFKMRWRVYYGTPETVRTVFEPAVRVEAA
jgi:hypothetical protein